MIFFLLWCDDISRGLIYRKKHVVHTPEAVSKVEKNIERMREVETSSSSKVRVYLREK